MTFIISVYILLLNLKSVLCSTQPTGRRQGSWSFYQGPRSLTMMCWRPSQSKNLQLTRYFLFIWLMCSSNGRVEPSFSGGILDISDISLYMCCILSNFILNFHFICSKWNFNGNVHKTDITNCGCLWMLISLWLKVWCNKYWWDFTWLCFECNFHMISANNKFEFLNFNFGVSDVGVI